MNDLLADRATARTSGTDKVDGLEHRVEALEADVAALTARVEALETP